MSATRRYKRNEVVPKWKAELQIPEGPEAHGTPEERLRYLELRTEAQELELRMRDVALRMRK